MNSKQKLDGIKNCIKDIASLLEDENHNIVALLDENKNLAQVNWDDFKIHINFWLTSVCNNKCYDDLSAFVQSSTITTAFDYFSTIKILLEEIKSRNYEKEFCLNRLRGAINIINTQSSNSNFSEVFDNIKSFLTRFTPFISEDRVTDEIKNIVTFTKEKGRLDIATSSADNIIKILKTKEDEITNFYNSLKSNDAADGKKGIKQFVEESHNQIKQKYEELFVTTKPIKIGDQQHPDSTTVGSIEFLIKDISAKQEAIKSSSEEIKELEIAFTSYAEKMKSQQDSINKMIGDTEKSLGSHVDTLMVRTFTSEARWKSFESVMMLLLSLGCLAIIALLGYEWLSQAPKLINEVSGAKNSVTAATAIGNNYGNWFTIIFRLSVFIPLGFGFWICSKRHDMASLLAAEYRYKRSIVEAMIGYRARYKTNEENIQQFLSQEYSKFFEKTFEEINKNPADKINKMLMKNNFSIKDLKAIIKDDKSRGANP